MALPRAPRSLTARALQWLAQREQSRVELRRKLLPHAIAEAAAAIAAVAATEAAETAAARRSARPTGATGAIGAIDATCANDARATLHPMPAAEATPADRVEAVLDWLEAHGYLSGERFVESRVNARSARFGNLRIRHELKQHQLALSPGAAQTLRDSELERARALQARKFGHWPADRAERARQARFLAGRGFTPEVIARALRGPPDESD